MFVGNPFTGAFGLDIGDLSLKLVQFSVRNGFRKGPIYKVEYINTIPLPPGYIVNGEIEQPEMVRKKLLQLLGKEGNEKKINTPWVIADLPEPKTFLTSIEMEMRPDQITKEDIEYQCSKHLPFDLQDTYLDWQIIQPKSESKITRVLIGAVPKVTADAYTYLLESADLQPIVLEVEALAIARSLIRTNINDAGAILDLGATRSSIIIYDEGGVRFSTSINFSGELINTALSQQLKLDYKIAEALKIKNGLQYINECPNYLKVVNQLVENLIDDINKIIVYYQNHYSNTSSISQIDLCGGMSEMQNLKQTLERRLKMNFFMGNSWQNINNLEVSEEDKKKGLTLASAIGMAMRATINPYNE